MEIRITSLHKVYRGGVHALNGLDLAIPNSMIGLLGPNGAGKTTLMRILAGIMRPSSGKVQVGEFDGSTNAGRNAIKHTLGYLPQDLGMYPDLSAREFLDYVGILKGLHNRARRQQRCEELLELVALSSVAGRKLKTYSGGMKRRVGIAQALLNNPQLLIVDEPTAGLDPEERIRFRNLLTDLAGERTIILSTHIVEDIAQTCQRLIVMKKGQAIFQGTTSEIIDEARHKVWLVNTTGNKPAGDFSVVSMINMGARMQYRIVGEIGSQVGAEAVEPNLEDSYVWLMRDQHPVTQSFV